MSKMFRIAHTKTAKEIVYEYSFDGVPIVTLRKK